MGQDVTDYEACAQCNHFRICHRAKCEGWIEGDRDDLVLECDCPEFVPSESN